MSLNPWPLGGTQPLQATLNFDGGGIPNFTGATLSLRIHNVQTGQDVAGVGQFGTPDPVTGKVAYTWAPGETSQVGIFDLYIIATYSSTYNLPFGPVRWIVQPT